MKAYQSNTKYFELKFNGINQEHSNFIE